MPPPSKIDLLQAQAPEVYEELNRRLVGSAFGNSVGLSDWLKSVGWDIGKTTVNEHAQKLKAEIDEVTEEARLQVEYAKLAGRLTDSDKAALLESNEMIAFRTIAKQWRKLDQLDVEKQFKALAQLMSANANFNRSTVNTARWNLENEERERIRREAMEEAAKVANATARAEGVPDDIIAKIDAALGAGVVF